MKNYELTITGTKSGLINEKPMYFFADSDEYYAREDAETFVTYKAGFILNDLGFCACADADGCFEDYMSTDNSITFKGFNKSTFEVETFTFSWVETEKDAYSEFVTAFEAQDNYYADDDWDIDIWAEEPQFFPTEYVLI